MRATGWASRVLLALLVVTGLLVARGLGEQAPVAHAATFTVNSPADGPDVSPGNGVCQTSTVGQCTLRAAIQEANALGGTDTINIALTGGGLQAIPLSTGLPDISTQMTIDGTTEGGWVSPIPLVIVRGTGPGSLPAGTDGLRVTAGGSGSTIKGLTFAFFPSDGIEINSATGVTVDGNSLGGDPQDLSIDTGQDANGVNIVGGSGNTIGGTIGNVISQNGNAGIRIDSSSGNLIRNNKIGTNFAGTVDRGNTDSGVFVLNSSSNTIGGTSAGQGNVISGNEYMGIQLDGPSTTGNFVQGNFIGTNAAGTAAVGNTFDGVFGTSASTNNTIGGTVAGARNIISGNAENGIEFACCGSNTVQGNYIGTNAAGTAPLGNTQRGVYMYGGSSNTIGGVTAGSRNVISGNGSVGIDIVGGSDVVRGNYIGVGADGTTAIANAAGGVAITSNGQEIGGGGPAGANVISGNTGAGITIQSDGNSIIGNLIGVAADGVTARGNGGWGVYIAAVSGNTVGRIAAGDGNVIANNGGGGIAVDPMAGTANDNTIRGNYIYSNSGLGIDLIGTANNSVAAPAIAPPLPPHGTACAGCTVDLYSDAGGQGRYYEGTVTADGGGNWKFFGAVTGANLTATATNGTGGTSEFSSAFAVPSCSGICAAGLWKIDFSDLVPPTADHHCTSSVVQSGATTIWGEMSCPDPLLYTYTGTLTPGPNLIHVDLTSSGGATGTSDGTYTATTSGGFWTCTFGCSDSGTWTGAKATASVPVLPNVPTTITDGVLSATITTPPGSPTIMVEQVPLENVSGGFLRTGYDFTPHGLTFDPTNPVRMDVSYNPTTDLPAGTDCRDIAHYRYDELTGTSTFQSRVGCAINNSFTVPITGFSVHRFEIGRDLDNDGIDDGPDVCPGWSDSGQAHSDSHILDFGVPGTAGQDWTVPYGDDSGDACDTDGDTDNDGLTDVQELAGCGFGPTSITNRDSDGDLFIDSAECALAKNPNSISNKPLINQCGASGDNDGDGLTNQVEFCKYGTDPNNANSDRNHFNISADTCDDGREAATVNANYSVDVTDLLLVAQNAGSYPLPPTAKKLDYDFNRNGSIDVIDLGAVAAKATPSNFKCQFWPTLP